MNLELKKTEDLTASKKEKQQVYSLLSFKQQWPALTDKHSDF